MDVKAHGTENPWMLSCVNAHELSSKLSTDQNAQSNLPAARDVTEGDLEQEPQPFKK